MAYRRKTRSTGRRRSYNSRSSYRSPSRRRTTRSRTRGRKSGTQTVRIVVEQPTNQFPSVPLGLKLGGTTVKGPKF